ncbi:M48 family metalloprotease [Allokutzneria albata]|uniref:Zn-dependent protease with chaperone function n=1 Tax=Allokutzneria albata TaxID=211114 RepID=A0A1G9V1J1_ALLAB|nr:M48 family metalloprotease [Allokutzneria albata]SDM65765.1 Zn-dependent protease with chaperone function [Allokutzneria albata]
MRKNLASAVAAPRIDERAVGAGTTVRFALLVVLMLAASVAVVLEFTRSPEGWGCTLAAGVDPTAGSDRAAVVNRAGQTPAYQACMAEFAPPPPWWLPLAWPALLLAVAGLVFLGLSAWKARRGRVVPLAAVDPEGEIHRTLAELAAVAGLRRLPRVVVDPIATSTGAVVFGSTRRPIVCLHGGLIADRHSNREGFRAVLLHEFAHIHNGDVTITYATVALWRAFLAVTVLPELVMTVQSLPSWPNSPLWSAHAPGVTRGFVLTAFMIALVYLARSDVLRTREIYADLTAVRWGAALHGFAIAQPPMPAGFRGVVASLAELWRTHPRWELRWHSLTDTSALFGVRALPMFLIGATTTLINDNFWRYLKEYQLAGWWVDQAVAILAAGLAAGAAGTALWRAVAHAVLTSRPVPSGVRAGLWLGAGMTVSELLTGKNAVYNWLPDHPEVVLLFVVAGAVFGWWTARCALLAVSTWRGRTLRPAMAVGLVAACLVLAGWLAWWQGGGALFVVGWPIDLDMMRQSVEQAFPGPFAEHQGMLSAIPIAITLIASVNKVPLALAVVAALWVVPLLAWTIRPGPARWACAVSDEVPEPLGVPVPSLPRVLLPGVLTGLASWGAIALVQAAHPQAAEEGGLVELLYLAWVFVVLMGTAVVAAIAASALCSRYRLFAGLIATQVATLLGLAGAFVLGSGWPEVGPIITLVVVSAAVVSIIVAAVGSLFGKPRVPVAPRAHVTARRACVAVACIAAVAVAAPEWIPSSGVPEPPTTQLFGPAGTSSASPQIKRLQIVAWRRYGGERLLRRFTEESARFVAHVKATNGAIDRSACGPLGGITRAASGYFRFPEPQTHEIWQTFITQVQRVARECERAAVQTSMLWIEEAMGTAGVIKARADTLERGNPTSLLPAPARELPLPDWAGHGGRDLLLRFDTGASRILSYVDEVRGRVDVTRVEPLCTALAEVTLDASGHFRIADAEPQRRWSHFIAQGRKAAQDCRTALSRTDTALFRAALRELDQAIDTARSVLPR